MSDDRFLERLRDDAAQLRYTPHDDALWTRLPARIRGRMQSEMTVAQMLARWVRPIAASFVMLAIVASLSVTWIERQTSSATDTIGANSLEITLDGDTYTLAE